MKWIRWVLVLSVLFAFALPVMGAGTAPPGELEVEQAMTNPLDPVSLQEAQEFTPTPLLDVLKTIAIQISADTPQHSSAPAAMNDSVMINGLSERLLMRPTSEAIQTADIRLWRSQGGVALCRSIESNRQHPLLT